MSVNNALKVYVKGACRPVMTDVKVFSVRTVAYLHAIHVVERAVGGVAMCLNVKIVTRKPIAEVVTMGKSIQWISVAAAKKSHALIVFLTQQDAGLV